MIAESKSLAALVDEYWQAFLENEPLYATSLGDRRYDDRLPDITPQGRARVEKQYESFLQRARQVLEQSLSPSEKLTRTALLVELQAQLNYFRCHLEEWVVDPLSGPQIEFQNVESYQPIRTPAEGGAMVKRWHAMERYLDDHITNLQRGLDAGKVSVRAEVEKVIEEAQSLLAKPDEEWPLLRPLTVRHDDWASADRQQFRDGLTGAVRDHLRPALARYVQFLGSTVLPRSRPEDKPGISHIPGGLECYTLLNSRPHIPQS